MTDMPLPHSPDAERAVIAIVLQWPDLFDDVDYLKTDDFHVPSHQWVWEIFLHLFGQGTPVDLLTITHELKQRGQYETVGGASFLTDISATYYHAENLLAYADMIRRAAQRRQLRAACGEIATMVVRSTDTLEEIAAESETILFRYTRGDDSETDTSLKYHMSRYYDQVEERYHNGGISGIPTGYTEYDEMTGGLHQGELTLIGARPSMGKTSLLLNIGYNVAVADKQALFISLEMTEGALCNRLMAAHTGMDSHLLSAGQLRDGHWEKFNGGMTDLSALPLHLHYKPGITPSALRSICRRHSKRHGLDLVVVDYLGLMGTEERYQNDNSKVSYLSRSLKILAGELNVPVMVACQLSREMRDRTDKRPQLWDLRDSGSLEQDADVVTFINRPDYYVAQDKPGMAELIIAKQRNGPVGMFMLKFAKGQTKFENVVQKAVTIPSWQDR